MMNLLSCCKSISGSQVRATVIIPTYNRPALLSRELQCLTRQRGDFIEEVLICDDGSTTDTAAAVEPFRSRLPNLRILHQEDLGFRAGQARNMGIREARGDILIFLDDDLLLPEGFVADHVAAHAQHLNGSSPHRVVLGFRHRTGKPIDDIPSLEDIVESFPDDRVVHLGPGGEGIAAHLHPWFFVYSCNVSMPNDPNQIWFNEDFTGWGMEDIELGYRLVHQGYQVVVHPEARVLHVEAPDPRDPFRCEERGLPPHYDSYVHNTVQFIDTYPEDGELLHLLGSELRWYIRDETGQHWIKNGHENDAEAVIAEVRRIRAEAGGHPTHQRLDPEAIPQQAAVKPTS